MLLFLSILGFFLSLLLIHFNYKKNISSIYLGLFFLLISLYGFSQYALLYSKSVLLIELLLIGFAFVFPLLYLIGPVLFWYIRSVLTDNHHMKKKDLWHLLPMIIFFLFALPYTFMPLSEKIFAAREVVEDVSFIQSYNATFLSELFPSSVIYLSRPVLILAYTLWSIGQCIRYIINKKISSVFSGQRFMKVWICLLLITVLVLVVSHILLIKQAFAMHFSELSFALNISRILSITGLIVLLVSPFFFPAILYGLPRVPGNAGKSNLNINKTDDRSGYLTKNNTHLESAYLISIGQKADVYMMKHKPYLKPDFNINKLAVEIDVPLHHLGYYLRLIKMQSFTDYRNSWRIEHAKTLMSEGKVSELTLEAIASLSGFSNRNSFRITFQKTEGITPSQFVQTTL